MYVTVTLSWLLGYGIKALFLKVYKAIYDEKLCKYLKAANLLCVDNRMVIYFETKCNIEWLC
jgi:hypothetical protein